MLECPWEVNMDFQNHYRETLGKGRVWHLWSLAGDPGGENGTKRPMG